MFSYIKSHNHFLYLPEALFMSTKVANRLQSQTRNFLVHWLWFELYICHTTVIIISHRQGTPKKLFLATVEQRKCWKLQMVHIFWYYKMRLCIQIFEHQMNQFLYEFQWKCCPNQNTTASTRMNWRKLIWNIVKIHFSKNTDRGFYRWCVFTFPLITSAGVYHTDRKKLMFLPGHQILKLIDV